MNDAAGADGAGTTRSQAEPDAALEHPAVDTASESGAEDAPEPVAIGTLFILVLFLMALAGLWAILYLDLLQR